MSTTLQRCAVLSAVVLVGAFRLPAHDASAVDVRGTLEGVLRDNQTDSPISGAEIRIVVAGEVRISDAAGRFSFGNFDLLGPDTVVIRHVSYDSMRLAVQAGTDLGPLDLELMLEPKPIELEGLLVEAAARRATEDALTLAEQVRGEVWGRDEIEKHMLSASHPVDALRWSGLVLNIWEKNDGSRCIELRARHVCALVYLNNVRVSAETLDAVSPEDIQSYVVVQPMEATTAYGTGAAGGVVVVFTRR